MGEEGQMRRQGNYVMFINISWAPVAHACNPSYLGKRLRSEISRITGSTPAQTNSSPDPISKITRTK
jgi:hypothetical protein